MKRPTVRAVIVSWNGAELLGPCLDSLLAQRTSASLRVVVVDNASTDGTAALLAERYPEVEVVTTPRNLGFAGGAAVGMADLTEDFVVLLNNDATLSPDTVEAMLTAMREPDASRVGAVTAKILLSGWFRLSTPEEATLVGRTFRSATAAWIGCEPHDPRAVRLVNSTGNAVSRSGAGHDRDWLAVDGHERGGRDALGFCGGAAMLRAAAVADAGGFDPWLFLYYEDTDLSWRMRAHGWTVRYAPGAVAEHLHAASSDTESPLFRYHNTRNALVVATRHAPAGVAVRAWARAVGGALRALVRAERGAVLRSRWRGLAAAAARLPRTLGERRSLWSAAVTGRAEVARLLDDL